LVLLMLLAEWSFFCSSSSFLVLEQLAGKRKNAFHVVAPNTNSRGLLLHVVVGGVPMPRELVRQHYYCGRILPTRNNTRETIETTTAVWIGRAVCSFEK
jgi:hypothetical protein